MIMFWSDLGTGKKGSEYGQYYLTKAVETCKIDQKIDENGLVQKRLGTQSWSRLEK